MVVVITLLILWKEKGRVMRLLALTTVPSLHLVLGGARVYSRPKVDKT